MWLGNFGFEGFIFVTSSCCEKSCVGAVAVDAAVDVVERGAELGPGCWVAWRTAAAGPVHRVGVGTGRSGALGR